jgi:hypothetical protein
MKMVNPFLYRLSLKAPLSCVKKKGRKRYPDSNLIDAGIEVSLRLAS